VTAWSAVATQWACWTVAASSATVSSVSATAWRRTPASDRRTRVAVNRAARKLPRTRAVPARTGATAVGVTGVWSPRMARSWSR
jgi:hypothetical protein